MIKRKYGYIIFCVLLVAVTILLAVIYRDLVPPSVKIARADLANGVCELDVGSVPSLAQSLDLEKLSTVFEQRMAFSSGDVVNDGWSQERIDFDCLRPLFTDAGWDDFLTYVQKQKAKISRWHWDHAWRRPHFVHDVPHMRTSKNGFDVLFPGRYRDGVYDVIYGECPFVWHLFLVARPTQELAIDRFMVRDSWACQKADINRIWIHIKGAVQGQSRSD